MKVKKHNLHAGRQSLAPLPAPCFLGTDPNRIYPWNLFRETWKSYHEPQDVEYLDQFLFTT
jgi:hypothetical protein